MSCSLQELEQLRNIESVMMRRKARQILFRQFEKFNGWSQTPAVFWVGRVLEILLQMHKCARGLNQPFEKLIVVGVQPKLLENIVRLVVALLIPTTKVSAIKRMIRHATGKSRLRYGGRVDIFTFEFAHELRNPLAFVHEGLNFIVPQMMGKPTFPEGHEIVRDRSQE